ncbi:MAG: DNA mismatch repair protein MutS, partial [Chlamydiia bacterium]|nr:DNA mismatch repair protein MutS [Chlamydiia bacterium]
GHFQTGEWEDLNEVTNTLFSLKPKEIVLTKKFQEKHLKMIKELSLGFNPLFTLEEEWRFHHDSAYTLLTNHFAVHSLDGYGLKGMVAAINAAGGLFAYLRDVLTQPMGHIREIKRHESHAHMCLDRITQKNLELTESLGDGSKRNTLLAIIDHTATPMGGRLIKSWLKNPLLCIETIHQRQEAIAELLTKNSLLPLLEPIRDLERLTMRISANSANPKELITLSTSLKQIPPLKQHLPAVHSDLLNTLENALEPLAQVTAKIDETLIDDPPIRVSDGNLIRTGVHTELDELRKLKEHSQEWLANYQHEVRQQTGIRTLRVNYNRVAGFYIEVSKGQADDMPLEFQRRQTLTNTERFISPELKAYEEKVLNAEEKIAKIEQQLFTDLVTHIQTFTDTILHNAQTIATLDTLQSLTTVAKRHNYCRPVVDESDALHITEGRHPVIEAASLSETFVPNDTHLNSNSERLFVITGPNMAGKSTYIRQVALITILAQMGSFIPAKAATIGLIDKVFTRIGASDDLSRGQSTFMVEMTETANILNHATSRSLVILDEIGRGTSTYDGISIAWAVAEHLLTDTRPKTLFATHYWELTQLEEKLLGAVNYRIAVHESDQGILFLRKIVRGGTDKSYGIQVARLAGIPLPVLHRAEEILAHLEHTNQQRPQFTPPKPKHSPNKAPPEEIQLTFF